MAVALRSVVGSDASLQSAATSALRGSSHTAFQASQAVPTVIAKTAAAAVTVATTGVIVVATVAFGGFLFNSIMPKSYREYKQRTGT